MRTCWGCTWATGHIALAGDQSKAVLEAFRSGAPMIGLDSSRNASGPCGRYGPITGSR